MKILDFLNNFTQERDKIFKTLESCKTVAHLETTRNLFIQFKNKWKYAIEQNSMVAYIVSVEEKNFLSTFNFKLKDFVD